MISTLTQIAIFASGCFWCTEAVFQEVPGVVDVISGYTGGKTKNPTYEEVSSKSTGHYEAVQVTFDPAKITYEELLEIYWESSDPTDPGGQFVDRGSSYRPAIFYLNEKQKQLAEESKKAVAKRLEATVYTQILPAGKFYPAEEYHQDFYLKSADRYQRYEKGSGRKEKLDKIWNKDKK